MMMSFSSSENWVGIWFCMTLLWAPCEFKLGYSAGRPEPLVVICCCYAVVGPLFNSCKLKLLYWESACELNEFMLVWIMWRRLLFLSAFRSFSSWSSIYFTCEFLLLTSLMDCLASSKPLRMTLTCSSTVLKKSFFGSIKGSDFLPFCTSSISYFDWSKSCLKSDMAVRLFSSFWLIIRKC